MSQRDYERGKLDGKHDSYNPPHESAWKGWGPGHYSTKELNDRQDYEQGRQHGKQEKKK